MSKRRETVREMLGGAEPQPTSPEPVQKTSALHTITAAGCYIVGLVLAFSALGAMWILVFR